MGETLNALFHGADDAVSSPPGAKSRAGAAPVMRAKTRSMTVAELFDVKDRVALVTGASSGLGMRFAELLAGEGAPVALVAARAHRARAVKSPHPPRGGPGHR